MAAISDMAYMATESVIGWQLDLLLLAVSIGYVVVFRRVLAAKRLARFNEPHA
jgi:hypothetical protein